MMRFIHMTVLSVLLSAAMNVTASQFLVTPGGVQYKDLKGGIGDSAQPGDVATMHFVGWIEENGEKGKELFNTRNRGKPVSFVIGTDKVMQGWNEGVVGMRSGGMRLLMVPPVRAYGTKGVQGVIPENTGLIFIIELMAVEKR
jgi:FKBP-type peptidyl-prolyl cis-trans isomerase